MRYYSYTNPGGRECNEDSYGVKISNNGEIFVVADGLGGHDCGDVASHMASDELTDAWDDDISDLNTWFVLHFADANSRILNASKQKNVTMKTTICAFAMTGNEYGFAHAGDSRAYYIHDGGISFVTEDHSVAYKKFKAGEIKKRDIAFDEDQSALLRTIGSTDRNAPDIKIYEGRPAAEDGILLCSDGAWEYFDDTEVLIDFLKASDPKEWVSLMLQRMIERMDGSGDNLTMIAVMF